MGKYECPLCGERYDLLAMHIPRHCSAIFRWEDIGWRESYYKCPCGQGRAIGLYFDKRHFGDDETVEDHVLRSLSPDLGSSLGRRRVP